MLVTLIVKWTRGSMWVKQVHRQSNLTLSHQERNIYYVIQVEVFLAKVFSTSNLADEDEDLL
jgi:hypothetical protein